MPQPPKGNRNSRNNPTQLQKTSTPTMRRLLAMVFPTFVWLTFAGPQGQRMHRRSVVQQRRGLEEALTKIERRLQLSTNFTDDQLHPVRFFRRDGAVPHEAGAADLLVQHQQRRS